MPEIADGVVEIKACAREPGQRTKIAVWSNDPNVDPVGACVGARGARVRMVVNELRGEKIDIVPFSDDRHDFVMKALQPAKVKEVRIDEETGTAEVIVPDYQLSLAIGKEGQNARLADPPDRLAHRHQQRDRDRRAGGLRRGLRRRGWAEGEWIVDPETGEQMWQPADGSPPLTLEQWQAAQAERRGRGGRGRGRGGARRATSPRPSTRSRRRSPRSPGRRRGAIAEADPDEAWSRSLEVEIEAAAEDGDRRGLRSPAVPCRGRRRPRESLTGPTGRTCVRRRRRPVRPRCGSCRVSCDPCEDGEPSATRRAQARPTAVDARRSEPAGARISGDEREERNVLAKLRVYELAKELGLTNKECVDLCLDMGYRVKSHSSSLDEAYADQVRRKADREGLHSATSSRRSREEGRKKKAPAKKPAAKEATRPSPPPEASEPAAPVAEAPSHRGHAVCRAAPSEAPAPAVQPLPSSWGTVARRRRSSCPRPAEVTAPAVPEEAAASRSPAHKVVSSKPATGKPARPVERPPARYAPAPAPHLRRRRTSATGPVGAGCRTSTGCRSLRHRRRRRRRRDVLRPWNPARRPRLPRRHRPPRRPEPPAGPPHSESGKPIPPPPGPPRSASGKPIPPPPGLGGRRRRPDTSRSGRPPWWHAHRGGGGPRWRLRPTELPGWSARCRRPAVAPARRPWSSRWPVAASAAPQGSSSSQPRRAPADGHADLHAGGGAGARGHDRHRAGLDAPGPRPEAEPHRGRRRALPHAAGRDGHRDPVADRRHDRALRRRDRRGDRPGRPRPGAGGRAPEGARRPRGRGRRCYESCRTGRRSSP